MRRVENHNILIIIVIMMHTNSIGGELGAGHPKQEDGQEDELCRGRHNDAVGGRNKFEMIRRVFSQGGILRMQIRSE